MDKILALDISNFLAKPRSYKFNLLGILEILTTELQNPVNRISLSLEFFKKLTLILKESEDDEISAWILRVFRNASVNCPQNQQFLFESQAVVVIVDQFLEPCKNQSALETAAVTQSLQALSLQVVGNSIVGNVDNCTRLLVEFNTIHWMIVACLEHGDDKVRNYAAMIGLTLTQNQPLQILDKISVSDVQLILEYVQLEFVVLWLESLISLDGFLHRFYPLFSADFKVKCLYAMGGNAKNFQVISKKSLEFFISTFKNSADLILTTNSTSVPDDFNVLEMTAMVELFCKLTQNDSLTTHMKSDKSFVISTIALLKSIHEIGANGENCFTPIEKLETLSSDSVNVNSEPGFLFKADLIRLLGSLVQGSEVNQNQVRDMGVLPVILNCTKVDGRNPFIPQCSVVTLKFLLERNPANQAYVQQLQKQ